MTDNISDSDDEYENDGYNDIYSVLNKEAKYFYIINEIERIEKPSALQFYRDYVSQNKPVIITGLLQGWKAYKKWTDEYLEAVMKDVEITVSITNDGLADAVKPINQSDPSSELVFCKPYEKRIPFQEYIKQSKIENNPLAYYIQYQNNSLNIEYQQLLSDIDSSVLDFAQEAFGADSNENILDAVNFWMGIDKAVTSLHQDPYENMYCVVKGTKEFTLLPPTDYPFLYKSEYPSASFINENEDNPNDEIKLKIVKDDNGVTKIPWIPVDPTESIENNIKSGYPLISRAHPLTVYVNAGEVLYLPSLYFHRVAQKSNKDHGSNSTIAINYWFDMKYNLNYVYFQMLKEMSNYNITSKELKK